MVLKGLLGNGRRSLPAASLGACASLQGKPDMLNTEAPLSPVNQVLLRKRWVPTGLGSKGVLAWRVLPQCLYLLGCCHTRRGCLRHRPQTLDPHCRRPQPAFTSHLWDSRHFHFPGKWVSPSHSAGEEVEAEEKNSVSRGRVATCVSFRDPGAPAREAAAGHWHEDCVFRVWGY